MGKLIKILVMKKLGKLSHLLLTLKVVGPDGIPREFFQSFDSLVKNDSEESNENYKLYFS